MKKVRKKSGNFCQSTEFCDAQLWSYIDVKKVMKKLGNFISQEFCDAQLWSCIDVKGLLVKFKTQTRSLKWQYTI